MPTSIEALPSIEPLSPDMQIVYDAAVPVVHAAIKARPDAARIGGFLVVLSSAAMEDDHPTLITRIGTIAGRGGWSAEEYALKAVHFAESMARRAIESGERLTHDQGSAAALGNRYAYGFCGLLPESNMAAMLALASHLGDLPDNMAQRLASDSSCGYVYLMTREAIPPQPAHTVFL